MNRNFIWAFVIACWMLSSDVSAQAILVDLTTDVAGSTGSLLDNSPTLDTLAMTPWTANVVETDAIGSSTAIIGVVPGLTISVTGGGSFDPMNSNVNTSGAAFGVNSPTPDGGSENASRFDVDAEEFLDISFSQDITLIDIHFTSFSGTETFTAGGTTFTDADIGGRNIGTFAGSGLFLSAGTSIRLEAGGEAGASVGIEGITIMTGSTTTLLGDVNLSGNVDFLDIAPFIGVLSSGGSQAEADIDLSGTVDFLDIAPFILILAGQ